MAVRFPAGCDRLGLGVGLDLPWKERGFSYKPGEGDRIAPRVRRFLDRHAGVFGHLFLSWQPNGRNVLDLDGYAPAWDSLLGHLAGYPIRALHHTALNLGAAEGYVRSDLFAFTNALVRRFGLRWVNEDIGLWSLQGKPLPYPLPPYLTDAGLEAAVANVAGCARALSVPLLVEFPGFSAGVSLVVGRWDAYDFFREIAVRTATPVTLDIGHLLSWRWLRGHRGQALYEALDRLPLDHCYEVHLSGCEIDGGRFIDAHHGRLLPEQLSLLRLLIPRCPHLRAVTYEDPRFDEDGRLSAATTAGFEALREEVLRWQPRSAP